MTTTERLYRMELALELFRRDYGIEANPEDYPELWESYLIATDEAVEGEEE